MPTRLKQLILVSLVAVSALYGVSFQQYKHFDLASPAGFVDHIVYIAAMHHTYDSVLARGRMIVPLAARMVYAVVLPAVNDDGEAVKISFYVVNFFFMAITAVFVYLILESLGFSWSLNLAGMLLFISNRVTVYTTAVPLVDSIYYCAVAVLTYFMLKKRVVSLACCLPILILSKEAIIPFLLVPLLIKQMRRPLLVLSLAGSFMLLIGMTAYTSRLGSESTRGQTFVDVGWWDIVYNHIQWENLVSAGTWHQILHPFALLWLTAILGFWINRRYARYRIPAYLFWYIPICLVYAFVLTKGVGRNLFPLFVLVIPYSLITIEAFFENAKGVIGKEAASTIVLKRGGLAGSGE
jgi:hypothetical protein